MSRWAFWLVDAVLVVVFAAAGRASHAEGNAVAALASTAWPFLVGMTVGWLLVALLRRRPAVVLADGVWVWLATIVVGMLLRVLTGSGTALSFVLVALAVTGALLLGWRWLAGRRRPVETGPTLG